MGENLPIEYNAQVSPEGNWEINIVDVLAPGLHTLFFTDNFGNEDDAFLYVQETIIDNTVIGKDREFQEPTTIVHQIETIRETVPPVLIWGGLLLLIVLLIFLMINFLLAKKIRKQEKGKHDKSSKDSNIIIWLSGGVTIFVLVTFGFISIRGGIVDDIGEQVLNISRKEEVALPISGTVRDPISLEPVIGVELSAGEVTIRTDEGGQFIFQEFYSLEIIRINHPELKKTVGLSFENGGRQDIFYSSSFYNAVITINEAQLRGEFTRIHALLEPALQKAITQTQLVSLFEDLQADSGVLTEVMTIRSVERVTEVTSRKSGKVYANVIRVTLDNAGIVEVYDFIFEDDNWWLLR